MPRRFAVGRQTLLEEPGEELDAAERVADLVGDPREHHLHLPIAVFERLAHLLQGSGEEGQLVAAVGALGLGDGGDEITPGDAPRSHDEVADRLGDGAGDEQGGDGNEQRSEQAHQQQAIAELLPGRRRTRRRPRP